MIINDTTILLSSKPEQNLILRRKCDEVSLPLSAEDEKTVMEMLEYVRNTHDEQYCKANQCRASVGIAAPQIGISKKMLAISIEMEDQPTLEFALINPKIVSNSSQKCYLEQGEACLSVVPDVTGLVPRYYKITVRGYDAINKKMVDIRLKDYPAVVMQHELDHLYGILYFDHIDKKNPSKPIEGAIVI